MIRQMTTLAAVLMATSSTLALAESKRELGAHEHGVGQLNIAIEDQTIAIEFMAPGADIVGFEYEATSDEDLAKIDTALETLGKPLDLFVLPDAAGCTVTNAVAELETEDEHDDHGHDDHGHDDHDDHGHDDHDDHDDHGHDDHDEDKAKADDHDHDHDHEEHAHDEHDHDEEEAAKDDHDHDHDEEKHADHDDHDHDAAEASHTEFHAEYTMTCTNPAAIEQVTFAYFDAFPNALELEIQVVSQAGAQKFEVERDAPVLDLKELL